VSLTFFSSQWGGYFESDGLLRGPQTTETVACQAGSCAISVPAPGAAVVFLTSDTVYDAAAGESVQTYATSHTTRMHNTAAVPGSVLAASNGMNAEIRYARLGPGRGVGFELTICVMKACDEECADIERERLFEQCKVESSCSIRCMGTIGSSCWWGCIGGGYLGMCGVVDGLEGVHFRIGWT